MYHTNCSMIEMSGVTKRTLMPGSCEVHKFIDVVIIRKDIESGMDLEPFCILSAVSPVRTFLATGRRWSTLNLLANDLA
jgi:hypothetical protein